MPSFMKGENAMVETVMNFFENLFGLIRKVLAVGFFLAAVVVCIGAYDISNQEGMPSAAKCAGFKEASLPQQLVLRAYVYAQPWTVKNFFFFRAATSGSFERRNQGDVVLIQLPFTGGTWYRGSDTN